MKGYPYFNVYLTSPLLRLRLHSMWYIALFTNSRDSHLVWSGLVSLSHAPRAGDSLTTDPFQGMTMTGIRPPELADRPPQIGPKLGGCSSCGCARPANQQPLVRHSAATLLPPYCHFATTVAPIMSRPVLQPSRYRSVQLSQTHRAADEEAHTSTEAP